MPVPVRSYLSILIFLFLHIGIICRAQNSSVYNLNSHNGLPSDNVYGVITDRYGYLWACTDKGVVKYNGYQCKTFTTADGLPTDDVWGLLEDLRGRIWLGCISGEVGYIYNDKYYKANLKNITGTIYPSSLRRCDSGIIFSTPHINNLSGHTICISANRDTIYPVYLSDPRLNVPDSLATTFNMFITSNNELIHLNTIFLNIKADNLNKIFDQPEKIKTTFLKYARTKYSEEFYYNHSVLSMGDFLLYHREDGVRKNIFVRGHVKYTEDSVGVAEYGSDEPIQNIGFNNTYGEDNFFYIYTRSNLLLFHADTAIKHMSTVPVPYKNPEGKIKPSSYIRHGLWEATTATLTNGLYFERKNNNFVKLDLDLDRMTNAGNVSDSTSLWWSDDTKKLLFITHNKVVKEKTLINGHNLSSTRINGDTVMFFGSHSYFFNEKTEHIQQILHFNNISFTARNRTGSYYAASKRSAYIIDHRLMEDSTYILDVDRYLGGAYDPAKDICWLYTSNKILKASGENKKLFSIAQLLGNTNEKIEKLHLDTLHGNLLVKTTNQLYTFDPHTMKSTLIPCNINLKDARIDLYKNVLVVYGNFGIAFYKILGKAHFSEPIIYRNTKETYYTKSFCNSIASNKVTLLTDNGVYEIAIPNEAQYSDDEKTEYQYNIIVYCNNKIKEYVTGDIDTIDQNVRKFSLDVINPIGNGNIVYYYRFTDTGAWQRSTTGEISLPQHFSPDNQYNVSVYVMDDAWKSDVISIPVYIKPYWWQTKTMSAIIWIGGTLLSVLFIIVIVLTTRRIVLRNSEKKNMQRELELKAIYAQINPHFIFNTLTSALLLISNNRMEEAYTHVSKFSKLLRSYLRSSRNKYVSIEEEIDNLRNYVELQQTRFKDRFISEIIVDEELNIGMAKIPSLLIQPFVENAINHGLLHRDKEGKLVIEFAYQKAANKIICTISDNGIGRHQSRENKKGTENTLGSYGNLMIKDLVNIINRYEKMHIDVDYIDKQLPETGTSIIITISNPLFE